MLFINCKYHDEEASQSDNWNSFKDCLLANIVPLQDKKVSK
jgi:hypothetical protein